MAINLPTFAVSARDYIRLTGQEKRDGGPICFSDKADTQIPDLQALCHRLTLCLREGAAIMLLQKLAAFVDGVESYLTDTGM